MQLNMVHDVLESMSSSLELKGPEPDLEIGSSGEVTSS